MDIQQPYASKNKNINKNPFNPKEKKTYIDLIKLKNNGSKYRSCKG